MRVLIIGAGGVGSAVVKTINKWGLFERIAIADYDLGKAQRAIAGFDDRFVAYQLNAAAVSYTHLTLPTKRIV